MRDLMKPRERKRAALRGLLPLLSLCGGLGCAQLHHVQLADIETGGSYKKPIDVKVSEVGISLEEAGTTAKLFTSGKHHKQMDTIQNIIALFQYGPKTGNPVFSDDYADELAAELYKQCPSGKMTGLTIIREARKYPIVSGEIVKILGYCLQ